MNRDPQPADETYAHNDVFDHQDIEGVLINAHDMTERKKAEAALYESEERYRAVVEDQTELICRFSHDLTLTFVNSAYARYFGRNSEELIGKNFLSLVPLGDHAKIEQHLERVQRERKAVTYEHCAIDSEGEVRWHQWTDRAIINGRGEISGYQSVGRDVTERRRAEEKLKESEERFRQLFEQSVEALLVHDEQGRYVDCNTQACLLYGYSREELLSLSVKDISCEMLTEEERAQREAEGGTLWQQVMSGQPGTFAVSLGEENKRKDGSTFPVEARLGSVDYGGRRLMLVAARDMTKHREAEAALRASEERFRTAFEDASTGVALVGLDNRYLQVNDALCEMLGYSEEELVGKASFEITHPEDLEKSCGRSQRMLAEDGPQTMSLEKRYLGKDGNVVWAISDVSLVRSDDGRPSHFVSQFQDITRRQEAEQELRESEERFRRLFEQSLEALIVHDAEGRIFDVNTETCRSLGYTREELLTLSISDLTDDLLSAEQKREREKAGGTLWQRIAAGDPGSQNAVHFGNHKRKDGTTFPIEVRVGGVEYNGQRLILASVRDVTERRELERRLEYRAFHDPLTELPNRELFCDRLEKALEGAGRRREQIAVMFLDLDDFKTINDSLGHEAGDELLKAVAKRLRACLRPSDTVARFGGDELALLLEDIDRDSAEHIAKRIERELSRPFSLSHSGKQVQVSASVGVALGGHVRASTDDLLRSADLAMYRVKRSNKAGHEVPDFAGHDYAKAVSEQESELRQAIEREEFRLHYQPVVSLDTTNIVGMEALVRWQHPERGLLYPAQFLHFAEESGLIVPISGWVLREACLQAQRWRDQHPNVSPLVVSVNLSAKHLARHGLIEEVTAALKEASLEPFQLQLEITESATIEDDSAAEVMNDLKALGVRLAVDDFGTGYSSISYLMRFPMDTVKIDRSIVAELGTASESRSEATVSAVIALAHSLGETVVAEGIEYESQREILRKPGCELGQGYHFGRPSPAAEAFDSYVQSLQPR